MSVAWLLVAHLGKIGVIGKQGLPQCLCALGFCHIEIGECNIVSWALGGDVIISHYKSSSFHINHAKCDSIDREINVFRSGVTIAEQDVVDYCNVATSDAAIAIHVACGNEGVVTTQQIVVKNCHVYACHCSVVVDVACDASMCRNCAYCRHQYR